MFPSSFLLLTGRVVYIRPHFGSILPQELGGPGVLMTGHQYWSA